MPRTTGRLPKINIKDFTDLMALHLEIALKRYEFIQNEYNNFKKRPYSGEDNFVYEYTDFYGLNAAVKDFSKPDVKEIYFNLLKGTTITNPDKLADEFQVRAKKAGYSINHHLSFCSKIIHTINPITPVYDSRICEYLNTNYFGKGKSHKPKYNRIEDWYNTKISTIKSEQDEIIKWFRKKYSTYSWVTDTKVLDLVIFVWNKYYI